MSSATSIKRPIPAKARNILTRGQLSIDIAIHDGYRQPYNTIPTFSTMEKIEGEVAITALHDTRFSDVKVLFVGSCFPPLFKNVNSILTHAQFIVGVSNTSSDAFVSAPFLSPGCGVAHKFLQLNQPIDKSTLPASRILSAGRSYTVPFNFVVPAQLLPSACHQDCKDDQVRAAHLQVPPSLGGNSSLGRDGRLLDDLASEMARISYSIVVAIMQDHETNGTPVTIAEASKAVRVEPDVNEHPPAALKFTRAKTLRKGFTMKKIGRLVVDTWQPNSLRLPGVGLQDSSPATTSTTLALRFDPAGSNPLPPKLGRLDCKLQVINFYSTTHRRQLASYDRFPLDTSQESYSELLPLSSRSMAGVQWIKHTPGTNAIAPPPYHPSVSQGELGESGQFCANQPNKHDVGMHKPSAPISTARPYYTADLVVPVQLPPDKAFVPTFHSCYISRTYRLHISLSFSATASLTVKVPIQVTAGGGIQRAESARPADAQVMQDEAEIASDNGMISESPATLNSGILERSQALHRAESVVDAPPDYGAIVS